MPLDKQSREFLADAIKFLDQFLNLVAQFTGVQFPVISTVCRVLGLFFLALSLRSRVIGTQNPSPTGTSVRREYRSESWRGESTSYDGIDRLAVVGRY